MKEDSPEVLDRKEMWESIVCFSAIRQAQIPPEFVALMERYFVYGIPPGSFGLYVLQNNLLGAANSADQINLANLWHIAKWIGQCFPLQVWGSKEKVERHMRRCLYGEEKKDQIELYNHG